MARSVALVAFGIVVGVLGGAALQIHAAPDGGMGAGSYPDPDQTGVDGNDQGDVQTPGVVPDLTAVGVGENSRAQQSGAVWDRLAECESSSDWHKNTGNGYFGGVQEDLVFWRRHGGLVYASRPDLATRGQQIAIAERGLAVQGWSAWPACSRRLGLR